MATDAGYTAVVSHRSGETEDATIADIAVFPYVALAPDGQISLDAYPHVLAWIDRVKHLSKFVGMRSIDPPTAITSST